MREGAQGRERGGEGKSREAEAAARREVDGATYLPDTILKSCNALRPDYKPESQG